MTPDSKTCPICSTVFHRNTKCGISNDRWRQQVTCSRACSVIYRKRRATGDHAGGSPRTRSKVAMNRNWEVRKAIAAAKARVPLRASREDEEAAIARFVAERGVIRLEPVEGEVIQARQEMHRPQPMAGWRG